MIVQTIHTQEHTQAHKAAVHVARKVVRRQPQDDKHTHTHKTSKSSGNPGHVLLRTAKYQDTCTVATFSDTGSRYSNIGPHKLCLMGWAD